MSLLPLRWIYMVRILKVFPGFWWKYRETLGLLLLPMRPVCKHMHQVISKPHRSQLCCNRLVCFFFAYSEVSDFYENVVWCLIKCLTKMFIGVQFSLSSQTCYLIKSVVSFDSSLFHYIVLTGISVYVCPLVLQWLKSISHFPSFCLWLTSN